MTMSTTTPNTTSSHNIMAGKWKEHVGSAKVLWGKLTDDEILKTEGRVEKLSGLVQQRYGVSKEAAEKQISEFISKIKN